jgi:hypothetical protein
MSAPKVTEQPEESYHAARIRAGKLNRAVAEALGWRIVERKIRVSPQQAYRDLESSRGMFGAPDGPTLSAGTHVERYWVDQDGKEQGSALFTDENEALPDWQGDTDEALTLMHDDNIACGLNWAGHFAYPGGAKYRAEIITLSNGAVTAYADTPAQAIVQVWLAWKETQ